MFPCFSVIFGREDCNRKLLLGLNKEFSKQKINKKNMWSRGRHFSPLLPGKRYRKFGSKSSHRAETLGNFDRYDALAPRPDLEVLRSFSCLYANPVLCTLCLRMCRCNRTEIVTIFVEQYLLTV